MPESINFDRAVGYYDATRGFPPGVASDVTAFIHEAAGLKSTDRLLEIGVGTGRIALPLSAHVGTLFGVDISAGMLGKLVEKRSGERVIVTQGDATQLPFAAGAFDAVIAVHVFHLVSDAERVAREVARVLKPGGRLLHCLGGWGEGLEALRDAWREATYKHGSWNRWDRAEVALAELGWRREDEPHLFHYPVTTRPIDFLDAVESRTWSSTWSMTDEAIAYGAAQVKAAIDAHFNGDAEQEIHTQNRFSVDIFLPPA